MAKEFWRSLNLRVALVTLIALGLGVALFDNAARLDNSFHSEANRKATAYVDQARVDIERRCARLIAAGRSECVREVLQTARQGRHDEYDLEAQRVTAVWTRHMGIAAIFGTAFGIIGVVLIWATFRETKRTANAAMETLRHSQNTSYEQLRAYVTFGIPKATDIGDGRWEIYLPIRNTGQTPATKMKIKCYAAIIKYPIDSKTVPAFSDLPAETMMDITPHSDRGHWFLFEIDDKAMIALAAKSICIFVRFQFDYTTYSGKVVKGPAVDWLAHDVELLQCTLTAAGPSDYAEQSSIKVARRPPPKRTRSRKK